MAERPVQVWDLVVRSVHWSLATLIVVEFLNEAGANPWHRYLGYIAAALVVGRLAWGCGNRGHASLAAMAASARNAPAYLAQTGSCSTGHTPPGALMAFSLWTLVLLVALTGWMHELDAFWGEEWLQQLHEVLACTLATFAVVHVAAAIVMSFAQRSNLIKSMITGNKPA